MKEQLKLTDFPINIDTICFKIHCDITRQCYFDWEFKNNKYFQTIRSAQGSDISIRYYPYFKCLSIWVDSVPGIIYGSGQIVFDPNDHDAFKSIIVDVLKNAMGLDNEFSTDMLDEAILTRIDLNQDYYFNDKNNEIAFRKWLDLCQLPYGKDYEYPTGGKKTTNAHNITYYSKDEQCSDKHNTYINLYGNYCTRIEFQIKNGYLSRQPAITLKELLTDKKLKSFLFDEMLSKMLLNGEIMNRRRLGVLLDSLNKKSHRRSYVAHIRKFYLDLGKYGYSKMRKKCKSYYVYLKLAKENQKVPIRLNDSVFKELNSFKKNHIL